MAYIPHFDEVVKSFGFRFASARRARYENPDQFAAILTRTVIAEEAEQHKQVQQEKERLVEQVEELKQQIVDTELLQKLTGADVRKWETGAELPTPYMYERIKEALNVITPLTSAEISALDKAFRYGALAKSRDNQNTRNFGEVLGDLIYQRREAHTLTNTAIAEFIRMTLPGNAIQSMQDKVTVLQNEIDTQEEITKPKSYFLVDGTGEARSLVNAEGRLVITEEDVLLIEHGIIPSRDLHNAIKSVLENYSRDLDKAYEAMLSGAPMRITQQVNHQLENATPTSEADVVPFPEAKTQPAAAAAPVEAPVEEAPAVPVQPPVAQAPAEKAPAPEPKAPAAAPKVETPAGKFVPKMPFAGRVPAPQAPEAAPAKVRTEPTVAVPPAASHVEKVISGKFIPPKAQLARRFSNPVAELAKTYAQIFAAFGLEAPSDTHTMTSRHNNSGGSRAELARKLNIKSPTIAELRPFSLIPLSEEVVLGMSNNGQRELAIKYNMLCDQIHTELLQSKEGDALQAALMELKDELSSADRRHRYDNIRSMHQQTGVPAKDFDKYFEEAGLRMTNVPDARTVLNTVNNQWYRDTHINVMRASTNNMHGFAQRYIEAFDNLRSLHKASEVQFEIEVGRENERLGHLRLLDNTAYELVTLRVNDEWAQTHPTMKDMKLSIREGARLEELEMMAQENADFAEAVGRAEIKHRASLQGSRPASGAGRA